MKATRWHNLVVPCLSEVVIDSDEMFASEKGMYYLNPAGVIRYQPKGALITLPQVMFESIYLDEELSSTLVKNKTISAQELSPSSFKLLMQSGLLLTEPAENMSYTEQHMEVANLPNRAVVELTNRCNCRCLICYHRGDEVVNYQPSLADIIGRIDKLKSLGVVNFEISGGEPLLRDDLTEILGYLLDQKLNYSVVTNGEFLKDADSDLIEVLRRAMVVAISLDGVGANHDLARNRPGLFDNIVCGVTRLNQKGISFLFIYTVQHGSVGDVSEAVRFAESVGAKIHLRPVKTVGSAKENQLDSASYQSVASMLTDPAVYNGFVGFQKRTFEAELYGCSMTTKIAVDVLGRVHPCLMDRHRTIGQLEDFAPEKLSIALSKEAERFLDSPRCRDCKINKNRIACAGICRFAKLFSVDKVQ